MYLPGVYYRFCEIPIVAAFLLFGHKIGVAVAILNVPAEILLFPGPAVFITAPFVLMLSLCMLLGIHLASKLLKRKASQNEDRGARAVTYYTAFGALTRTAMAPLVLFPLYRFLLALMWMSLSDTEVFAMMPFLMLYAFTFSLYTIPIGYLIARMASRNLKVGNRL